MATTAARSQLPFYFSSAGSNDEAKIEHDGSDFLIDNDTGDTKFGDKSNYHLTIHHSTGCVEINNFLSIGEPESVQISGGAVTATKLYIEVESETGVADELDTVNMAGVSNGWIMWIQAKNGHTITVKDSVGNMQLNGDRVLGPGVAGKLCCVYRVVKFDEWSYTQS